MRDAPAMGRDRDGRRARSGGNSAINTNIFRSVLQPCFDNHPLQRSRVPSPSYDSYHKRTPRQILPSPLEPLLLHLALPAHAPSPVRVPLASHPLDLKYVDTLAHIRAHITSRAYATIRTRSDGRVSHPFVSPSPPTIPHPCAHGLYSSARFDIFRKLRPARTSRKSILR